MISAFGIEHGPISKSWSLDTPSMQRAIEHTRGEHANRHITLQHVCPGCAKIVKDTNKARKAVIRARV